MSRRLKPVKDLSILILAPRKHDRQLWADLLRNCGINNPLSMADVTQAASIVGSGQVDVVFVDEAYGPQGIANVLIPARNVEFAGGRGVCLVLCSKKATAQDVLNARKLGFASLVILPASTDTVRKHLELAARYIPPSDEELGWSKPKAKDTAPHTEHADEQPKMKARMTIAEQNAALSAQLASRQSDFVKSGKQAATSSPSASAQATTEATAPLRDVNDEALATNGASESVQASEQQHAVGGMNDAAVASETIVTQKSEPSVDPMPDRANKPPRNTGGSQEGLARLQAPGRSGQTAEEEVVFL